MGKMNNAFMRFVLSFCWGGGRFNGLGQLHSLSTGSSYHVQMKWTSYGIIFTKVDWIKKIFLWVIVKHACFNDLVLFCYTFILSETVRWGTNGPARTDDYSPDFVFHT